MSDVHSMTPTSCALPRLPRDRRGAPSIKYDRASSSPCTAFLSDGIEAAESTQTRRPMHCLGGTTRQRERRPPNKSLGHPTSTSGRLSHRQKKRTSKKASRAGGNMARRSTRGSDMYSSCVAHQRVTFQLARLFRESRAPPPFTAAPQPPAPDPPPHRHNAQGQPARTPRVTTGGAAGHPPPAPGEGGRAGCSDTGGGVAL